MGKRRTPWFHPGEKPVHIGFYETDSENKDGHTYQYWNGEYWGYCHTLNAMIEDSETKTEPSQYQNPWWRGLAKKP